MHSLSIICAVLLLLLVNLGKPVTAQFNLPAVACPDYFQYLSYSGKIIGKVTLPNVGDGTTRLDVKFSQREPVRSSYYGSLSLFHDQQTTLKNIESGQPVSYRVDFPIDGVAPKITQIAVNDYVICSASPYQAPNTVIDLQHTLQAGTNTVFTRLRPNGGTLVYPGLSMPVQHTPSNMHNVPQSQPNPFFSQDRTPILPPVRQQQQQQQQQQQPQPVQPSAASSSSVCGRESSTITPFIHGGDVANRGQYPWLTPIYHKLSAGLKFICGGSLLTSRTIITAAHCFAIHNLQANQIVVYVGRYKLDSFTEEGAEPRELSNLLINPEYSSTRYPDADIAILHMSRAVSFTQFIRPICLWTEPPDASLIVGQSAIVAGWGADESGNSVSVLPKWVTTNIVQEADCLRMDGFKDITSPRTICAGNLDGTGPCKGDSGGGLMLSRNGRWTLRGIVSAGQTNKNVCDLSQYVVYCDLAKHAQWINTNMLS